MYKGISSIFYAYKASGLANPKSASATFSRYLHNFPDKREQVVIGNHSAVLAALTVLNNHSRSRYGKVSVIVPPFWLENVHLEYLDLPWGQNISDLPWQAREIFKALYPNHPEDQLLNWRQAIHLRAEALKRLSDYCTIIYGKPEPLVKGKEGWEMLIQTETSTEKLFFSKETHFYNTYRVAAGFIEKPRPVETEEAIPHTDLYRLPKQSISNTIVIGSGLSVQWVRRDFIGCPVVVVAKLPLPNTPETQNIPDGVAVYDKETVDIIRVDGTNRFKLINRADGKELFEGIVAYATGFRFATEITESVSEIDSQNLHAIMPNGSKELMLVGADEWNSAKKTPIGSLLQAVQLWMLRTQNVELLDLNSFHAPGFPKEFTAYMVKHNIHLNLDFFESLREQFRSRAHSPTEPETVKIFLQAFKPIASSDEEKEKQFEKTLYQFRALQSLSNYGKKEENYSPHLS